MYIRYNLLGLGLCLEPHIPENIVNEMNKVLVQQWNLLDNSSLSRVSETLRGTEQGVKDMPIIIYDSERYTYTSTSASNKASRVFSLVDCHIDMSNVFTRKGHTALSKTLQNKYLLQERNMT